MRRLEMIIWLEIAKKLEIIGFGCRIEMAEDSR